MKKDIQFRKKKSLSFPLFYTLSFLMCCFERHRVRRCGCTSAMCVSIGCCRCCGKQRNHINGSHHHKSKIPIPSKTTRRTRMYQWYMMMLIITTLVVMAQYAMWQAIDETIIYLLPDQPGARLLARWLVVLIYGALIVLIVIAKSESMLQTYMSMQYKFVDEPVDKAREAHLVGKLANGSSSHYGPSSPPVVSSTSGVIEIDIAVEDRYTTNNDGLSSFMDTTNGVLPDVTSVFTATANNPGLGPTSMMDRVFG